MAFSKYYFCFLGYGVIGNTTDSGPVIPGSSPGIPTERRKRAFSSAGSEHLPYKQRVGGSNPSTPTRINDNFHS